jgi:hypothetical protein
VLTASYSGAWAADIDLDGDLDILLGNTDGAPTVLRNNGNGTFAVLHPFEGVTRLRGFAYADFDADGDPDAALLDADGRLRFFSNERLGQFRERGIPSDLGRVAAVGVADANRDGVLDLIMMRESGELTALSSRNDGHEWTSIPIPDQQNAPEPGR